MKRVALVGAVLVLGACAAEKSEPAADSAAMAAPAPAPAPDSMATDSAKMMDSTMKMDSAAKM